MDMYVDVNIGFSFDITYDTHTITMTLQGSPWRPESPTTSLFIFGLATKESQKLRINAPL